MKIGLIGERVAEASSVPDLLDGLGAPLARRYETLVASAAAAPAFAGLLGEFRAAGGRVVVVVPPTLATPEVDTLQAAEVHQARTPGDYLEALLGDLGALLCCPGGLATLHELHHFLAAAGRRAEALDRVLVYLYDRDKYFAPWRLQVQLMVETGAAAAELERAIRPFESSRGLRALIEG